MLIIGRCSICSETFDGGLGECFSTVQFSTYYYCPQCGITPPSPLVCVSCQSKSHTMCRDCNISLVLHRPSRDDFLH